MFKGRHIRRGLTTALALSMTVSTMALSEPSTTYAAVSARTPGVGETLKFDFGENAADGYIGVNAAHQYYSDDYSILNTDSETGLTYGFLGLGENGYQVSDRTDRLTMDEGMEIILENGGSNGVDSDYVYALESIYADEYEDLNDEFDFGDGTMPIRFALNVEGQSYYDVKATIANSSDTEAASVSLYSERGHQIATNVILQPGETKEISFSAAVMNVYYVKSEPKETYNDTQLNVMVAGKNAALASLEVTRVEYKTTIFLLGDSTGCDQYGYLPVYPLANYTGVGQGLTAYFEDIALSNQGEGGLSSADNAHFNLAKSQIKEGDYLYVEYGHNESSVASYASNLAKYYEAAHEKGAKLIIVGPIDRSQKRQYDSETNKWTSTLSSYSKVGENYVKALIYGGLDAAKEYATAVAESIDVGDEYIDELTSQGITENGVDDVAFIDLNEGWLEFLSDVTADGGYNYSKYYYTNNNRGSADTTHINDYGANNAGYIFATEVKELYESGENSNDEAKKIQAAVVKELYTDYKNNRSDVSPDRVSEAVINAGVAPNSTYPQKFTTPEKVEVTYPVKITEVSISEKTATVKLLEDITTYAKVVVRVNDASGNLKNEYWTTDWIDNTSNTKGAIVTLNFEDKIEISDDDDDAKALVYPVDESEHEYDGESEAISDEVVVKDWNTDVVDIALNKSVKASATRSGYEVSSIVDGDSSTLWTSGSNKSASVTVDLSGAAYIESLNLNSTWSSFKYKIEISKDGEEYELFYDHTDELGEKTNEVAKPDEAGYGQYVKVTITATDPAKTNWVALADLNVYGYFIPDYPDETEEEDVEDTNDATDDEREDSETESEDELVDLALGKSVTASKAYSKYYAKNAVDGDSSTVWSTGGTEEAYIIVDLGVSAFIDYVVVNSSWSGFRYKIEISRDGEEYVNFYNHSKELGLRYNETADPVAKKYGQYVKVTILETDPSKTNWVAIADLNVMGYEIDEYLDDEEDVEEEEEEVIPIESASLSVSELTLTSGGETYELSPTVEPENADVSQITWTSSNKKVATVSNGLVTSVGVGNATITGTYEDITLSVEVNVVSQENLITNDTFYVDTDGNPIYSQGGGIFKFEDKYYWYGIKYKQAVDYSKNPTYSNASKSNDTTFEAVTCYSSEDLVNWDYEGDVLTTETPGLEHVSWFGRMGVMYNEKNDNYVLVAQGYLYRDAEFTDCISRALVFFTCDTPNGDFGNLITQDRFEGGLAQISTGYTGDQTVFIDDDGTPYLIVANAQGRNNIYVCQFNEDYTQVDSATKVYSGVGREGDCMFKYDGHYYIASSDLHGWNASPAYVLMSDSEDILGSYTMLSEPMENSAESYSHVSQTGFFYTVKGSEKTTVLFCGDRWSGFAGNGLGFHVWEPLSFDENGYPIFNDLSQFYLNDDTGEWSVGPYNNYAINSSFEADRVSISDPTGWDVSDNVSGSANANYQGSVYSGHFYWAQKADVDYEATISQNIDELPEGTYTFRAWVRSSGGQDTAKIYIKDYSDDTSEEASVSVAKTIGQWTLVTVCEDLSITSGHCEIGLMSKASAGQYVYIDDISLVRTDVTAKPVTNVEAEDEDDTADTADTADDTVEQNTSTSSNTSSSNAGSTDAGSPSTSTSGKQNSSTDQDTIDSANNEIQVEDSTRGQNSTSNASISGSTSIDDEIIDDEDSPKALDIDYEIEEDNEDNSLVLFIVAMAILIIACVGFVFRKSIKNIVGKLLSKNFISIFFR